MENALRNEITITLDGRDYTLRATFSAIRAIERDLRTNLVPLIGNIARRDVGIEQCAIIIHHGLIGYGDKSLMLDQVGDLVMKTGVGDVMGPIVTFLTKAMEGIAMGKSEDKEAVQA
jgi:hypothetical protein